MKRFALLITMLFLFTFTAEAQTQDRSTTSGPVWLITEYRIKPGSDNTAEFIKFMREHEAPLWAEMKRQGLILDYKFFRNEATYEPNQAQFVQAVLFQNYSQALDPGSDEERMKKALEIALKRYGSPQAALKARENLPNIREVARVYTLRELSFNPPKSTASGN